MYASTCDKQPYIKTTKLCQKYSLKDASYDSNVASKEKIFTLLTELPKAWSCDIQLMRQKSSLIIITLDK